MPKQLRIDKAEIFSIKYIIIMGLVASILTFASWIQTAVNLNLNLYMLLNAGDLNTALTAGALVSALMSKFIVGMILSGIMLLITIFLFRENSVILFDYKISKTQMGILLIILSLFNMIFGAHGWYIGGILGMVAGVFLIINDIYIEDWKFQGQLSL